MTHRALGPTPRILVRANNWIGDVVMISPAVRALRETWPRADIAILAKPWVCDALGANPFFDRLIPYDSNGGHKGLLGRWRLIRALRADRFDLAVLFQKAFDAAFLVAAAGVPRRVGYATDHRGWLLTNALPFTKDTDRRHHIDVFLDVARAAGASPSSDVPFFCLSEEDRAFAASRLGAGERVVAIHPGGSKAPRAWHAERFAQLAVRLAHAQGLVPLVVGDHTDAAAGERIASAVPGTRITAGTTSVRQMGALIERAALFVGNDSGPMHIAGALGTPTVGIFGPGTPEKTSPRGANLRFEAVTARYPCSPCRQDFFKECRPAASGKPHCLEDVTVDAVLAACTRLLAARVTSAAP